MTSFQMPVYRKLWPYLWPENMPKAKIRLIVAISSLFLSKLSLLYVPILLKALLDFATTASASAPYGLLIGYVAVRLGSSFFSEIKDVCFVYVTQRAIRQLSLRIFKHLHQLSLRFHLDRKTGGIARSIERASKSVETLLLFFTFNILPTIIEITLVCGALWYLYDALFSLVTFVTIALYVVYTIKITEWRAHLIKKLNQEDDAMNTRTVDSLLNYETVKYFGNDAHEANTLDKTLEKYEVIAIKSKLGLSYLNMGQSVIISMGLGYILFLGLQAHARNILSIGDIVAINAFLLQLYIPLFNLGYAYREIKIALVNLAGMFDLLKEPQEIKDLKDAPPLHITEAEIRFEQVSFSYGPERPILEDISFVIPSGKTVAIVGHSGAGKSTLSRLLFRFFDVCSGKILIDGQDIRFVSQESLRGAIGIVPQDTVLFNDTIYYNIAYGNPQASPEAVKEAAQKAHIHHFIISLPQGYNTIVGERGLKLSGGEKQRIAIARTLLKKPRIFLFDEATSALDTHTEKDIQKSLHDLSRNVTTLIIAHRLSTIMHADKIIVLEKGRIIEEGTHTQLLEKKGAYASLWKKQEQNSLNSD